jgi:hypothetical protein
VGTRPDFADGNGLNLEALKILVLSDIRHRGQGFRKALLLRHSEQHFFKDRPVFGLSAPPMPGGALLERIDEALIKVPDDGLRSPS